MGAGGVRIMAREGKVWGGGAGGVCPGGCLGGLWWGGGGRARALRRQRVCFCSAGWGGGEEDLADMQAIADLIEADVAAADVQAAHADRF